MLAWDLRGHGTSTPHVSRRSRFGYYDLVTRDWKAVVQHARRL